jgi:hypothetical protein
LQAAPAAAQPAPEPAGFWTRRRLALAVGALLAVHVALAVESLVLENPTN